MSSGESRLTQSLADATTRDRRNLASSEPPRLLALPGSPTTRAVTTAASVTPPCTSTARRATRIRTYGMTHSCTPTVTSPSSTPSPGTSTCGCKVTLPAVQQPVLRPGIRVARKRQWAQADQLSRGDLLVESDEAWAETPEHSQAHRNPHHT